MSISFQRTSVFVLTAQDLTRLSYAIANSGFHIFCIGLKCANQELKVCRSIEELLRFDNAAAQAIQKLSIDASSDRHGGYQIWFSNEDNFKLRFTFNNVGYRFESDAAQTDLEAFTKSLFAETKAWYSFLRSKDFFYVCYLYLVVILFFVAVVYAPTLFFNGKTLIEIISAYKPSGSWSDLFELWVVLLIIVLGFLWFRYALRLRDRLFPIGTFAIGFGERRHATLEFIRSGVIIAFVISTISGIVIIFFQTHFH